MQFWIYLVGKRRRKTQDMEEGSRYSSWRPEEGKPSSLLQQHHLTSNFGSPKSKSLFFRCNRAPDGGNGSGAQIAPSIVLWICTRLHSSGSPRQGVYEDREATVGRLYNIIVRSVVSNEIGICYSFSFFRKFVKFLFKSVFVMIWISE